MKARKSKPRPQTVAAVAHLLSLDSGITRAHRLAVIAALQNPPGADTPPGATDISAAQAASALVVSIPTLLRWIHAGKLKARQFGGRQWVVDSESLAALVASRTTQPASLPPQIAARLPMPQK